MNSRYILQRNNKDITTRIKEKFSLILVMSMLLSIGTALATPVSVNAVSKRTKAVRAYKKFLKQNKSYYKKFSLIYLDKDKIPELLVSQDDAVVSTGIYTYLNGKVKQVQVNDYLQLTYTNNKFKYYKKTGVFKYNFMSQGVWRGGCMKIVKGKMKAMVIWRTDYRVASPKKEYYKYTGKKSVKIKKSAYEKAIKKMTKGKKPKVAKFYSNTKSGRKHCKT